MYLPWKYPIPGRVDLKATRLAWLSAWFNSRTFGLECFSAPPPPLDRFKIGGSVTVSRISCTVSAFPVFIPLASKWWVAVTDLKPGLLDLMVGAKMVGLMVGAKMVEVVVVVGAKMGAPSLSTPKKPSMLLRLAIARLDLCQRTRESFSCNTYSLAVSQTWCYGIWILISVAGGCFNSKLLPWSSTFCLCNV